MVYLREITEGDLKVINKHRSDKELITSLVTPFRYINNETDDKWFQSYQNNRNNNIRCVICTKESDEVVGVAYLLNIDWITKSAEFGIFIGELNYRGKGIGKKATIEMLQHGFNDMNLNRIQIRVLENNIPAINLYNKMGFKEEGLLREAIFKNNEYHNLIIMSILKQEFKY
ncbi:GNAT family N-acetyltransferase [Peribacillus huizhouensis]|uniref:UDP-4-amino-4, 6-dideoxy-N-acetyl-beta-L-altrosamine N-acetyltransferase n=1 Tax=Peribacillus huizhouensis TaxID=1501239 RepID=A0ABR6CKR6_9BACI|nr:GNAT family protein [Peribacillus huizhouensis]MBA9025651.1 UDP-4-amino-4,6-dideoxy-N-acetyl-beta-L-altrosamine N-acetyltransferase [Peribacillus huizhouensis]